MKVYVINGTTESGDDYLYIWQNKPSYALVKMTLIEDWPNEFDADGMDATMNIPALEEVETED